MPHSAAYASGTHERTPALAGRRFPVDFANHREGKRVVAIETTATCTLWARFDAEGFLYLDVVTSNGTRTLPVGDGDIRAVLRIDPNPLEAVRCSRLQFMELHQAEAQRRFPMTPLLIVLILAAIVAGILLKNALHAIFLIALVFGVFFVSCYAFDISPRVLLTDGVVSAEHVYHAHKREVREWLD